MLRRHNRSRGDQSAIARDGDGGARRSGPVEGVAWELLGVALRVEGVGPVARVPRRVAPTAAEEAQAARHREGDGHSVVVQAVVLLVRVDPDNGEDDGENEERREHHADGHLAYTATVHRHTGAAQLADTIGGLLAFVRS